VSGSDTLRRGVKVNRLAQVTTADHGRVLMFAEYGPADGLPVLTFRGTPQCRLRVERTESASSQMWASGS
jgi:hypothetical protein